MGSQNIDWFMGLSASEFESLSAVRKMRQPAPKKPAAKKEPQVQTKAQDPAATALANQLEQDGVGRTYGAAKAIREYISANPGTLVSTLLDALEAGGASRKKTQANLYAMRYNGKVIFTGKGASAQLSLPSES